MKEYPHCLDSERALLGGIISDGERIEDFFDVLKPDDFYRPDHGRLWELMVDMFEDAKPIDMVTVPSEVIALNNEGAFGGLGYVMQLPDHSVSTAGLSYYVSRIRDLARRRAALASLEGVREQILDQSTDVDVVVDEFSAGLVDSVHKNGDADDEGWMVDAVADIDAEEARRIERGRSAVLPTGLTDLDDCAQFLDGDFVILMAHPSHGKTSLGLQIANNVASGTTPYAVAYFILGDMKKAAAARRVTAQRARVSARRQRLGKLSPEEAYHWAQQRPILEKMPIRFIDRRRMNINQLRARALRADRAARKLDWEDGLRLIVVDYIQKLQKTDPRQKAEETIREASEALKDLAEELQCVVLALAQPNRVAMGERGDKRPKIHHIAGSSALERDADLVLAAYYHAKVVPPSEARKIKHDYEVQVLKQREGVGYGRSLLYFEPEYTMFRDLTIAERKARLSPPKPDEEEEEAPPAAAESA